MAEQTHEKRLRDLVDRWEELRAQGVEPSEAELCKDAPELLGELQAWVRAMKATDFNGCQSRSLRKRFLSRAGPKNILAPRISRMRREAKPVTQSRDRGDATLETFVALLTASGLMSAAELQAFRSSLPADKQPANARERLSRVGAARKAHSLPSHGRVPEQAAAAWCSANTWCSTRSGPAAWARSTRPGIAAWTASWRSRCSQLLQQNPDR